MQISLETIKSATTTVELSDMAEAIMAKHPDEDPGMTWGEIGDLIGGKDGDLLQAIETRWFEIEQ